MSDDPESAHHGNLFVLLRAACHQLTTQAAAHAGEHVGVSAAQALALIAVAELEPCSLGRLADRVGAKPAAATTLMQRLERDGFVERRRSVADGRVVTLHLTPRGADRARDARAMVAAFDAELREGLSAAELEVVGSFLVRATRAISDMA